jgi:hypothetical protein
MALTPITPADPETQALHDEALLTLMPIDRLKALWDEYDGGNYPGGFSGELIHLVLNLRGHGDYCPV